MGIGRREFLRRFGAAIASAGAGGTRAVAINDDFYINRRLGIAFRKPGGWVFSDVSQMRDLVAGQKLDTNDPQYEKWILANVELPILIVAQEEITLDADHFAPGVSVYLDRFSDLDTSVDESPLQSLDADVDWNVDMLKDFRVTSSPRLVRVSECDAATYEATFRFEHRQLEPTPVRMRTLAIEQETAFYTLRMYDAPELGETMEVDYEPFMASVAMV